MTELVVYGASDDLIEFDGAIRAEFSYQATDGTVLVVSDIGEIVEVRCVLGTYWRNQFNVRSGRVTVETIGRFDEDDLEDDQAVRLTFNGNRIWIYAIDTREMDSGRCG